jgi:hypothetical protein
MHGGNKLKAAKELGISRCYLHRLLNQLNLVENGVEERELQVGEGDVEEPDELRSGIERVGPIRAAARIA